MSFKGEEVIGVHKGDTQILIEGINESHTRYYCSNCKRKIHCYIKLHPETNEPSIHYSCKTEDCQCKCRTHYSCKNCGHIHPHGQKCLSNETNPPINQEQEETFQKLMDSWREGKKEGVESP